MQTMTHPIDTQPLRDRVAPLPRSPGVLLGVGLGGLLDGIVLHQVLQWHSMLSQRVPLRSLEALRVNMFWDGAFHAAMWLVTVLGVVRLVQVLRMQPQAGRGRLVAGDALLGWGSFNMVEGLVNHQLLGLHHVVQAAADPLPADLAFLAFGAGLAAAGWAMGTTARRAVTPG
ncbi:MAG TPA: DUF2243 domain-containing protein [Burkholderiaceae bacterium]|nr:DUF2243 domain-containing protein [Burkholderiaceae bacterium]